MVESNKSNEVKSLYCDMQLVVYTHEPHSRLWITILDLYLKAASPLPEYVST